MREKNGKSEPESETVKIPETDVLRAQLAAERRAHAQTALEKAQAIAELRRIEEVLALDQLGAKHGVRAGDRANIDPERGELTITRAGTPAPEKAS